MNDITGTVVTLAMIFAMVITAIVIYASSSLGPRGADWQEMAEFATERPLIAWVVLPFFFGLFGFVIGFMRTYLVSDEPPLVAANIGLWAAGTLAVGALIVLFIARLAVGRPQRPPTDNPPG